MIYTRKCERCQKEFQASRPHGKFCNNNCRVGYFSTQKRRKEKIQQLQAEIKEVNTRLLMREAIIAAMKNQLHESQAALQQVNEKLRQLEAELALDLAAYCKKYDNQIDPLINRKVISLDVNKGLDKLFATGFYNDRQKAGRNKRWLLYNDIQKKQQDVDVKLAQIERENAETTVFRTRLQALQKQLATYLLEGKQTKSDASPTKEPSNTFSILNIGAADLLKREIKTFVLPGRIGDFFGELERHMLAIALVGDPGAGKSTMTMAIARAIDQAGYKIIFYSLELGISKPLQDMIRRNPLSNQMRITDKGDIEAVRESAKEYDLVMVDSFGKLGCKAEEWDRLRQDFPDTMFLAIFQKTTSGSSRGGASIDYDASTVIDMTREKESGKRSAHMRKSRYGTQGNYFYPEEDRILKN